jgi:hypothetical protein
LKSLDLPRLQLFPRPRDHGRDQKARVPCPAEPLLAEEAVLRGLLSDSLVCPSQNPTRQQSRRRNESRESDWHTHTGRARGKRAWYSLYGYWSAQPKPTNIEGVVSLGMSPFSTAPGFSGSAADWRRVGGSRGSCMPKFITSSKVLLQLRINIEAYSHHVLQGAFLRPFLMGPTTKNRKSAATATYMPLDVSKPMT